MKKKMNNREEIVVLKADDTKQLKLGWVMEEKIGFCVVNPRALDPNYEAKKRISKLPSL